MKKLQPYLKDHWRRIKSEEEKAFKFLSTFWYYLRPEYLELIYGIIKRIPVNKLPNYEIVEQKNNKVYDKNQVIDLLGLFLQFPDDLSDFIELGFNMQLYKYHRRYDLCRY